MKKIIIFSLAILTLTSCNDWLTVTPEWSVEANDLLQDEDGYNSAISGVYYVLNESNMYGKDLTFGMMDVLAQYWTVNTTSNYYDAANFSYQSSSAMSRINTFWKNSYVAIAECNRILEGLEINRQDISNSELIEAEVLGLRAFCHMELFRWFGPVIRQQSDLDKVTISYRTKFDVAALKFESGKIILGKVKQDLLRALELAQNDPIKTIGRRGDANTSKLNYNYTLANRGSHMNYFAILGMLARVEQLLLNQDAAYAYATRILKEVEETKIGETPVFVLVDNKNMDGGSGSRDYNYSREMLFALYHENLYDITNFAFGMDGTDLDSKNGFPITPELYQIFSNEIFAHEGGGTDNRLRYGFEKQTKGEDNYDLTKLRESKKSNAYENPYEPEIPIMRLAEVYYIACEAQIGKDNVLATSYLNKVREARNLKPLDGSTMDDATLLSVLVRDMRKEFIGEGRLFPTYKRLNHQIYAKGGTSIEPSDLIFVFPIPDDEYAYSPNEKPE